MVCRIYLRNTKRCVTLRKHLNLSDFHRKQRNKFLPSAAARLRSVSILLLSMRSPPPLKVLPLVGALTEKLTLCTETISIRSLSALMYGLQGLENNSQEVKQLIAAIGVKLSAADEVPYTVITALHMSLLQLSRGMLHLGTYLHLQYLFLNRSTPHLWVIASLVCSAWTTLQLRCVSCYQSSTRF